MGLIKAVILDWAGTAVDFGSMAPVRAIQALFARHGLSVADGDARRDMGLPKREHIRRLSLHLDPSTSEAEVDALYREFVPLQMEILTQSSALIPGVVEAAARMRERGIRIGSTTGYTRRMLDVVITDAKRHGYHPECAIVPDEAGGGRPHPYMIYQAATRLQCYPLNTFVKVGDTPFDIAEGRNAGTWTVGVSETGNSRRGELERAGAHFVIDSVAVIDHVLDEIEMRLAKGRHP